MNASVTHTTTVGFESARIATNTALFVPLQSSFRKRYYSHYSLFAAATLLVREHTRRVLGARDTCHEFSPRSVHISPSRRRGNQIRNPSSFCVEAASEIRRQRMHV